MRQPDIRGLDLNLLVLLDALVEHRSVTRAAAAKHISQPAMSRALGRLRGMLGDPILARGSAGLVPTPRALALHPALKRLLAEAGALVAGAAFDPFAWRGDVRLAATDHQTTLLLPPLMARLSREAPRLDLTVVPFLAAMVGDLRDGRIHLAFGVEDANLPPGLRREQLYSDTFATLLRHGHPAAEDWSLARFAALDHVLVTVLGDGRSALDDRLRAVGLARRVALRLPHFAAAMEVVARTDLVVTLPRSLAARHADRLTLQMLPLPLDHPGFTHVTIWSEVLSDDDGVTWLRAVIAEVAREFATSIEQLAGS